MVSFSDLMDMPLAEHTILSLFRGIMGICVGIFGGWWFLAGLFSEKTDYQLWGGVAAYFALFVAALAYLLGFFAILFMWLFDVWEVRDLVREGVSVFGELIRDIVEWILEFVLGAPQESQVK